MKFEKLIYSLLLNFDYLKQSFRWLSNSNVDSEQEKKETQAVKETTKKIVKLMRTDCTDKPEGFSFVEMRCKELLDSIKTCLFLPVAEENKDDVGCKFYLYYEISDWAENLDSIHLSLLSNQDAWGPDTAIACIKEEYDIIMAGVNSIKLEEERRLLHKIDRANRSLFLFGE